MKIDIRVNTFTCPIFPSNCLSLSATTELKADSKLWWLDTAFDCSENDEVNKSGGGAVVIDNCLSSINDDKYI